MSTIVTDVFANFDNFVADGKPLRQMFFALFIYWLICSLVVDGIATIIFYGRCYNQSVEMV